MNARVTSESQSFRLVERMEEAKISHGQELRADLSNVRVLALAGVAEVQALFCNMGPIRVREVLNRGDDRPLPAAVALEGLAQDLHHALVRFGVIAKFWKKKHRCWRVEITEPASVERYQQEIGWFGEVSDPK